jgi:hypothetical protein
MIGYHGCKDQWEVELEKASKSGLLELIEWFAFIFGIRRENMLKHAKAARRNGRWNDAHKAHMVFMADPKKALERAVKKSAAAKKAARRRKKESRSR